MEAIVELMNLCEFLGKGKAYSIGINKEIEGPTAQIRWKVSWWGVINDDKTDEILVINKEKDCSVCGYMPFFFPFDFVVLLYEKTC